MKREHINLCSYNPKQSQNVAKSDGRLTEGVKRRRSAGSDSSLRKEDDRWPRTNGKSVVIQILDFKWLRDLDKDLAIGENLEFIEV